MLLSYGGKTVYNDDAATGGNNRRRTMTMQRDFAVAREGIEPPTRGFSVRCSTN
jgi:SMC interacting uncharacterized protein involved in chromosome segregation